MGEPSKKSLLPLGFLSIGLSILFNIRSKQKGSCHNFFSLMFNNVAVSKLLLRTDAPSSAYLQRLPFSFRTKMLSVCKKKLSLSWKYTTMHCKLGSNYWNVCKREAILFNFLTLSQIWFTDRAKIKSAFEILSWAPLGLNHVSLCLVRNGDCRTNTYQGPWQHDKCQLSMTGAYATN